jgi:hypothetical protein
MVTSTFKQSRYSTRCSVYGRTPLTISHLGLCCLESGLPEDSSFLDLAAVLMGKKPGEISIQDAIDRFGPAWASKIIS